MRRADSKIDRRADHRAYLKRREYPAPANGSAYFWIQKFPSEVSDPVFYLLVGHDPISYAFTIHLLVRGPMEQHPAMALIEKESRTRNTRKHGQMSRRSVRLAAQDVMPRAFASLCREAQRNLRDTGGNPYSISTICCIGRKADFDPCKALSTFLNSRGIPYTIDRKWRPDHPKVFARFVRNYVIRLESTKISDADVRITVERARLRESQSIPTIKYELKKWVNRERALIRKTLKKMSTGEDHSLSP